jgi:UPF0755 protein
MFNKFIYSLLIFLISFSLVLIFFIYHKKEIKEPVIFEVKNGESVKEISRNLERKGIINHWEIFYFLTRIRKETLKKGTYEFKDRLSAEDVWRILSKGKEKLFSITIVPGDNLFIIAEKLENKRITDKKKFLEFVFNPENVKKFNLKGSSFEGYFPPETYLFRRDEKIQVIVNRFLDIFKKRYLPHFQNLEKLKPYDVMKIASMVEKETSISEEKPIIAGIIINRLKKRMHLQVDATVIYAMYLQNRWNGNIKKSDLKSIKSPFNTYLHYGLPPTPICSFSVETVLSTLNYKETDYLYYLTVDNKKHIFSKSYEEHKKIIKTFKNH